MPSTYCVHAQLTRDLFAIAKFLLLLLLLLYVGRAYWDKVYGDAIMAYANNCEILPDSFSLIYCSVFVETKLYYSNANAYFYKPVRGPLVVVLVLPTAATVELLPTATQLLSV